MNTQHQSMTRETVKSSALTNFWLITLAIIVGLTILITAVLVGWPIISHLAAKFMG